jgi:hypothetical protein
MTNKKTKIMWIIFKISKNKCYRKQIKKKTNRAQSLIKWVLNDEIKKKYKLKRRWKKIQANPSESPKLVLFSQTHNRWNSTPVIN